MGTPATNRHDLRTAEAPGSQGHPGRWESEAEQLHQSGPEDSVTKSSRIYFFVIFGVIVAAFAVFLILRPR